MSDNDEKPANKDSYSETIAIEHALEYASRYFHSHAEQRLKTLRYFLAYVLLLAAAWYKILIDCNYGILFFFSLVSELVTIFFFVLELRNRQLVKIGSLACRELEAELISRLPKKNGKLFEKINIVQQAESNLKWYCYRKAVMYLFWTFMILQFLVLVASFFSWLQSEFSLFPLDLIEFLKEGCQNKK